MRAYFQEIGRKSGNALKEKHGSAYFSRIAGMRKSFGRKPMEKNSVQELSNRFGVTRQRLYQILESHGKKFNEASYEDINYWREAVVSDFFKGKEQK